MGRLELSGRFSTLTVGTDVSEDPMRIPENIRIPAIVFGLEAILLTGAMLIFLVL